VVISVSLVGVLLLTYYFTGIHEVVLFVVGLFFMGTLLLYIFKKENMVRRWVLVSLLFAITINIFLNSQFYPLIYEPFFILCDIKIHLDIPFPVRHALPPFFIRV
jgi:hypothetical protein